MLPDDRMTLRSIPRRFRWLTVLFLLGMMPFVAQAQLSDAKVEALVEALRVAAPPASAGLYSDWRVKPDNIVRWSKRCLDREVTPEQFAADQAVARPVLVCVMGPVLRDQFAQSNHNEMVAVQRAAAWWMTGDPTQYRTGSTGDYTLRVLEAYLRFF
jgi:hypothetical protein